MPTIISPLQPLILFFKQYGNISDGFIKKLEQECSFVTVRKNKHILSPIDSNAALYFVTSGIVRGFIKDEGKDITTWFSFGNEIIGAIRHPHENPGHSVEYLHALEECELIRIPYTLIDFLYTTFPETNLIGRKLLALQYHEASERSILARIPTAGGRFERLQKNMNHNLNSIPLRYLASFLGMRVETLSRIRTKSHMNDKQKLSHA